jgi:hypothetical protein
MEDNDMTEGNGWDEYKRLVVHELERCNKRLDKIDKRLHNMEQRLTIVYTKVYMAAFFVSAGITGLIQYIINN